MFSCVLGIQNMTTNILKTSHWQMVEFSADDIFGIGSQPACEKLGRETAQFAIIDFYLETMPNFFKMGACLPTQCSSNVLQRILKQAEPYLQSVCWDLLWEVNISYKLSDPNRNPYCHWNIHIQHEKLEELRNANFMYYIIFSVLLTVYALILLVTTYKDFKSFSNDKSLLRKKVFMKNISKKSYDQLQKIKSEQRQYQKVKLGVLPLEIQTTTTA